MTVAFFLALFRVFFFTTDYSLFNFYVVSAHSQFEMENISECRVGRRVLFHFDFPMNALLAMQNDTPRMNCRRLMRFLIRFSVRSRFFFFW